MKNILVPTNFTENCQKAAELAIELAKLYNAEIHFLHYIKTPVDWVQLDKLKEERYPETLKQIGSAKANLRELEKSAESQKLKCRTFLQYDVDDKSILDHSSHFQHDFIITGSSGTKGVIREITGSNVEDIINKAKVPVIVVKDEEIKFPFKSIVFVSNFEEDVNDAFKQVISIAKKCNAKIHLLQINTKTDYNSIESSLTNIDLLLKKFSDFENYSIAVYNEDSVETGISKFSEQQPVDLIAMVTHGKTGFLSLFSKSIAEGVTNHSNLPVMTIHI